MTVVGGVPTDQGSVITKVGARFGPRHIREESTFPRALFEGAVEHTVVDIDTHVARRLKDPLNLVDIGDFDIDPTDIMKTTDWVTRGVADVVRRGGFPVVLGGDHYIAYPDVEGFYQGMRERKANVRVGYLHVDSHTDFRNDYGGYFPYNHATCVRRLTDRGTISFPHMAWIGLNGSALDIEMFRMMKRNNLRMYSVKVLRERGINELVREVMEVIANDVDAVYVSIDIDVVSNEAAKGIEGAVFFGLSASEFLELMDALSTYEIIRGMDMCEVTPPMDPSGITGDLAVAGLLAILKHRLFEVSKAE
jgi:arginase family enzyme